jgi:urate oxidase
MFCADTKQSIITEVEVKPELYGEIMYWFCDSKNCLIIKYARISANTARFGNNSLANKHFIPPS